MTDTSFVRAQVAEMHRILEMAIADCTPEMLSGQLPGATINTIGAIYGHAVFGEDGLVNALVRGQTPVYYAQGWAPKVGIDMPQGGLEPDWHPAIDLPTFREYAAAVYQATDDYLANASDEEMARVVELGFAPPMPVSTFFRDIAVWHIATHQGEISALKGVRGVNGLVMTH